MSDSATVRVDTHRLVMVLYGLCGSARSGLDFQPHPHALGAVVAAFAGRNGGRGQVSVPDHPALRETLNWLAAEPKAEVYLRAVLAAVRACDGIAGGWAYERVLELLWGPRKRRQSRWRKLPPVRRILELLCQATWALDAPVTAARPPTGKARRRDKDRDARRAAYGGSFAGRILELDERVRTVRLDPELRRLLDAGPYDRRPAELFALARPGHTNPRGRVPSRATCWLMVQGAWDYARFRQAEALRRDGTVQAVAVEDLLGRWTSVDVDGLVRRRLLPAVLDRLGVELGGGEVALDRPIERTRQPGRSELRLHLSERRRPRSPHRPAPPQRRHQDDRRPPSASTPTGTAASTGPPA